MTIADTAQPNPTNNRHVIIIGGGIAGLSAAWTLQQAGIAYTLLEQLPTFGGLVQTERVDALVIEHGPDAFITRKPAASCLYSLESKGLAFASPFFLPANI